MSQNAIALPLVGVYSGTQAATYINNALDTLATKQSGSSAPSGPALGWDWLDTSIANQATWKVYDGAQWVSVGTIDETNHRWVPVVGGGTATVPSAGTTDLWDASTNKNHSSNVIISGVTTITSFGSTVAVGVMIFVTHSGVLTLTHNATTLVLPTGANITTAAGDTYLALCKASGEYRVLAYQKADGTPLVYSGTVTGSFALSGILAPASIGGDQNDYNPASLATASMLELTSSVATVNITGLSGGSAGRVITIRNANALAGGKIFRFPAESTSSSASNRFSSAADITLRPGEERMFKYDTSGGLNRWIPQGHISAAGSWASFKKLKVNNNSGTPNSICDVTADELILEDADGNTLRLTNVSVSPNMATSGAGGLDTGAEAASTWYSVWVIYNPATSTVSSLFSVSATAPTMPSGYTFKMRVGWMRNDGSSDFLRIFQYGRRAQYKIVSGTNTAIWPGIGQATTAAALPALSLTNFIPTDTAFQLIGFLQLQNSTGAQGYLYPSTSFSTSQASTTAPVLAGARAPSNDAISFPFDLLLESTNVYANSVSGTVTVYAVGWVDNI